MLTDRLVAVFLAAVLSALPAWAQGLLSPSTPAEPGLMGSRPVFEQLVSSSAADRFREIAGDVAQARAITGPQADQAIIFLTAARRLNAGDTLIAPLLLRLATRHAQEDYSEQIVLWLEEYVDGSADRAVVDDSIRYLLDRLNSREQRQQLLEDLVNKIGNKNPAVDSSLAMLLGLLMLERGDSEAARFYMIQAYTNNKYNEAAFGKLAELVPDEIGPATYLEHLRLVVRENPLDLDAILNFAQYAERLQLYAVASESYRFAAELFRYLYPTEPVQPQIYLPWAISSYNTADRKHVCLEIAENVRNQGRFDILLEAIAGRAAAQTGDPEQAKRIFHQAEQKARQLLQVGPERSASSPPARTTPVRQLSPKQVAWFYCFADPNAEMALDWANRAYSVEPNVPSTAALLAYAFSMNRQLEWAKPLLVSFEHNQIADLVQARVQLSEGQTADALQTLLLAVAKDPGSLAAEQARDMLREQGSPYIPPVDPNALIASLAENLGKTVVPRFLPPDQMLDVQFSMRGSEFSYGSEIDGTVAIRNKGHEPLVLTEDSLFTGNIRVDVRVTAVYPEKAPGSGVASSAPRLKRVVLKEVPNLISRTVRTALAVPPGRSLVGALRLSVGELRHILLTYPQASLEIRFTLYLDPVVADDGSVSNRLTDVEPTTVVVTRPGIELTGSYVRNRFSSISSGQEVQKVRAAQLFTGLLKEQHVMFEHGTLYPFRYQEWLPNLLRSALLSETGLLVGGGPDEWVVQVNTMADMLSMSVDRELAEAVAKNLLHSHWPVRLMAVYLLAGSSGDDFAKVLVWVAESDAGDLVRRLAVALRSGPPIAAHCGPMLLTPSDGLTR